MTFEEVVESLNKRGIFMVDLTQLENGKKWSVRVWSRSKCWVSPQATGTTVEQAVKGALAHLKAQMTDKDWAEVRKASTAEPKKRVKSK